MFGNMKRGLLFDEAPGSVPPVDPVPAPPAPVVPPVPEVDEPAPDETEFDTWLAAQPKAVQDKFTEKYGKLSTTLAAERKANKENRKAVEKLSKMEADEKKRLESQMTKQQLLEKQNLAYRAAAEKASTDAEEKLLKAAALLKAKDMGFENPADAFALADKTAIKKRDDGDYDEASIEAVLKPLIGRLLVKTQGSGIGSAQLRTPVKINQPAPDARKNQPRPRY